MDTAIAALVAWLSTTEYSKYLVLLGPIYIILNAADALIPTAAVNDTSWKAKLRRLLSIVTLGVGYAKNLPAGHIAVPVSAMPNVITSMPTLTQPAAVIPPQTEVKAADVGVILPTGTIVPMVNKQVTQ